MLQQNRLNKKKVRLFLDDRMAFDGQKKFDLDVVKADLEVALVSSNVFAKKINELNSKFNMKK
jgi:hypothetical protein